MNCAIIDIGSNTVKLCIGSVDKGQIKILYQQLESVQLSAGFNQDQEITFETLAQLHSVLDLYIKKAQSMQVATLKCVATEAIRKAQNEKQILTEIQAKIPDTSILTGQQEATLIGQIHIQHQTKNALIVDIGGGSVEFIEIRNGDIQNLYSTPLGSIALAQKLKLEGQLSASDIQNIKTEVNTHIRQFNITQHLPLIGTEGAFTNLFYALHKAKMPPASIEKLDFKSVIGQLKKWQLSSQKQRESDPDLDPQRQHIAHIAAALLLIFLEIFESNEVWASSFGLKESLLVNTCFET